MKVLATRVGLPRDLMSSEAILEVVAPKGVDADAWTWLQAQPKGGWSRKAWLEHGEQYVPQLVERFPASECARQAVGIFALTERGTAWMQKGEELSKGTPLADYYRTLRLMRTAQWDAECMKRTPREAHDCMKPIIAAVLPELAELGRKSRSPSVRHLALTNHERLTRPPPSDD